MRNMYRILLKRRTTFCYNTTSLYKPSFIYNFDASFICNIRNSIFDNGAFFKAHLFFRKRRNRGSYVDTNANLRREKLKTKDINKIMKMGEGWGKDRVHKRCVIGDLSLN